jgi:hypothetical protein
MPKNFGAIRFNEFPTQPLHQIPACVIFGCSGFEIKTQGTRAIDSRANYLDDYRYLGSHHF